MEAKIKSDFKAVECMRQIRNELATLFQIDKKRFHDELKTNHGGLYCQQRKASRQQGITRTGADE